MGIAARSADLSGQQGMLVEGRIKEQAHLRISCLVVRIGKAPGCDGSGDQGVQVVPVPQHPFKMHLAAQGQRAIDGTDSVQAMPSFTRFRVGR